jgi:hypothetical protein
VKIGVVGDVRREPMASDLYEEVGADFLSVDHGGLGCSGNHLTVWRWHADNPDGWSVTLEDDAVPVEGFREQLEGALAVAPAPIVSLYLGRGYIGDSRISESVRRAEQMGANWLLGGHRVLHAVGLAVRSELVPELLLNVQNSPGRIAIDYALSQWARRNSHDVAYTVPSLVDHRDSESLVTRYRRLPRTAWRAGRNAKWTQAACSMF